jgi:hypothetical protein
MPFVENGSGFKMLLFLISAGKAFLPVFTGPSGVISWLFNFLAASDSGRSKVLGSELIFLMV